MNTVNRSAFDHDYVRIETLQQQPLLRAVEFDVPKREDESSHWRHAIAFLLLVAGLFGFAWMCGCWG